jgi:Holliday junction resolvase YEN1
LLSPTVKEDNDTIEIYTMESIRRHFSGQIDQDAFVALALLLGGDYSPVGDQQPVATNVVLIGSQGLTGSGVEISSSIAQDYKLRRELASVAHSDPAQQSQLLQSWCDKLEKFVLTTRLGSAQRLHGKLAENIRSDRSFAQLEVLLLYTHPLTSWHPASPQSTPPFASWMPKHPDLPGLASVCERSFSWGAREDLMKKFSNVVWPAVVINKLCMVRFFSSLTFGFSS